MKVVQKLKSLYFNAHIRHWVGIITLMAISVLAVNFNYNATLFLSAVLGIPQHEPFDGTVLPIQTAPNWSNLSADEYDLSYSEMSDEDLIAIPDYRTDYLTFDSSKLIWGKAEHNVIRNTKITYPVPYTGNYELDDCGENCGSHPAVDIKVPTGTPVHVIANGVVVKAGTSTGFGKTIVVKHVDVAAPDGSGQTVTLYSSYSHLSSISVTEGDVLTKNAVIGAVGSSGTATTPHLHFQLDNSNAPWHPYWPFTTVEANAAGYNFWDAVSNGVGKDNVYAYTHNPMTWIYDNYNYEVPEVVEEEVVEEEIVEEEVVEEEVVVEREKIESSIVSIDFAEIKIDSVNMLMIGDERILTVSLLDWNGKVVQGTNFGGEIDIELSNSSLARTNVKKLDAADFDDGEAEVKLYGDAKGKVIVNFKISGDLYGSKSINIIDDIQPFGYLGIETDGAFVPGVSETVIIQAMTLGGEATPTFSGSENVELEIVEGSGTLSKTELTSKNFSGGAAEIELLSEDDEKIVIAVTYKGKTVESAPIVARLFTDFDGDHEYFDAVYYLYDTGTVQGYPDGSFRPNRTVSRVEALKFIFSGMGQGLESGKTVHYNDTENGQWYSDYLATAAYLGIVQGYSDGSFKPTQGVNRVEFLKILFGTVDIEIDPVVSEDPYEDVKNLSWYAPYVQYAKENELFPINGDYFEPSKEMSRVEVAEVIYRLLRSIK